MRHGKSGPRPEYFQLISFLNWGAKLSIQVAGYYYAAHNTLDPMAALIGEITRYKGRHEIKKIKNSLNGTLALTRKKRSAMNQQHETEIERNGCFTKGSLVAWETIVLS